MENSPLKREQFVALLQIIDALFTFVPNIEPNVGNWRHFSFFAAKPKDMHMDMMQLLVDTSRHVTNNVML